MTTYKYIRVGAIVWAKMERLKAEKSFSTYIESMLKYFELTGINPESLQAPLAQETKNGIEQDVFLHIQKLGNSSLLSTCQRYMNEFFVLPVYTLKCQSRVFKPKTFRI